MGAGQLLLGALLTAAGVLVIVVMRFAEGKPLDDAEE